MSTWLVTGAGGMLAADLVPELRAHGHRVVAATRAELDITDTGSVVEAVRGSAADVVVNTAAYTAVDEAETHEDEALRINGLGAEVVARACAAAATRPALLHLSTDYVFDGAAHTPYAEDAPTGPRSSYGRTKLAGELAVLGAMPDRGFVVRTAWLYGTRGPSFVSTMVRLERERDTVEVVDDQHGQPTSTVDLSRRLRELGERAVAQGVPAGIYHGTSAGRTTWFGLARAVFDLLGAEPERVVPITSAAFPRPAPRPAWSVLGHARWSVAGLPPLPDWRSSLAATLPRLTEPTT